MGRWPSGVTLRLEFAKNQGSLFQQELTVLTSQKNSFPFRRSGAAADVLLLCVSKAKKTRLELERFVTFDRDDVIENVLALLISYVIKTRSEVERAETLSNNSQLTEVGVIGEDGC